jgi:hypothetical protein
MALRIRGCTSEGPGPIRVRTGGINGETGDEVVVIISNLVVTVSGASQ